MNNFEIEYGMYKNKIPYLIREKENPSFIIFEPSRELIKSLIYKTDSIIKTYNKILPANSSLCILGYDPNSAGIETHEQIAEKFSDLIKDKYRPGIIIGISYGGAIAVPFAALYPELTKKMILLVSAYAASPAGIKLMNEFITLIQKDDTYKALQKFNSLFVHRFYRTVVQAITFFKRTSLVKHNNPPSTFINAYKQIIRSNGENKKYLSSIKAPSLIIGGDGDQFFSKELFEETANLMPRGKAVVLKSGGHYVVLEKLKEVKRILTTFIESE